MSIQTNQNHMQSLYNDILPCVFLSMLCLFLGSNVTRFRPIYNNEEYLKFSLRHKNIEPYLRLV